MKRLLIITIGFLVQVSFAQTYEALAKTTWTRDKSSFYGWRCTSQTNQVIG
ncbi:hypothetical protein M4I21_01760 [Cellulophaga sp. 20_2_10]|uniref:hypothetical protein n=1 Tax=Cellulophaga sp. 20_2_10 TaxID=2942476 RepID=UPI00201A328C|nr:hypothetical protein [Cellulophaga sp. 20_2_10]MCL5244514.1 hypothetical protein [Cellulophaga sp. 20_2_10]